MYNFSEVIRIMRTDPLLAAKADGWDECASEAGLSSTTIVNPYRALISKQAEIIEQYCIVIHNAYEAAAADAGWETQAASRKPWAEVPEANKITMRVAVAALVRAIADEGDSQTGPVHVEKCPAGDGLGDHESQHFDGHWRCLRCGYHPDSCCGSQPDPEPRDRALLARHFRVAASAVNVSDWPTYLRSVANAHEAGRAWYDDLTSSRPISDQQDVTP